MVGSAHQVDLSNLYDPYPKPSDSVRAHQALDQTADRPYLAARFETELERFEFLFAAYQRLTTSAQTQSSR